MPYLDDLLNQPVTVVLTNDEIIDAVILDETTDYLILNCTGEDAPFQGQGILYKRHIVLIVPNPQE